VHRRLKSWIGDQGDRMAVGHGGQGEAEPEGPAGGLDDGSSRRQVPAGQRGSYDVQGGAVLDATGVRAFEFRPVAAP